jgi:uncharacterized protein YkwD
MSTNKNINTNLVTLTVLLAVITFLTITIFKVNVRSSSVTESAVFVLVNKVRTDNNLNPLKSDSMLQLAARNKAVDIKAYKYFAHNTPNNIKWNDFITNQGYKYVIAGENLAKGYYNPEELIKDWLASPSHKENIMYRDYTETGISIIDTDNMGIIVVQIFAKPIIL